MEPDYHAQDIQLLDYLVSHLSPILIPLFLIKHVVCLGI
jgi:hypothetical protein